MRLKKNKDIERIRNNPKNVRFEVLDKVLKKVGFKLRKPKSGSSHYTYKKGYSILTVPKHNPVVECYVKKALEFIEKEAKSE
ncbi:MAG: toxin HicA [bacterium]|nr:toxin HicA [bacterium]